MRKVLMTVLIAAGMSFSLGFAALTGQAVAAPTPDGVVVVLNSGDASVSLIDKNTQKVVQTFPVGKEPHHLMATPDNQSLIVANSVGNNLVFLNPKTGQIQRKIENIEDPYQIGFSPDKKWFVANGLHLDRVDIYQFDGKNLTVAKRLPLAKMPSHLVFTEDSKTVFISLQESNEVAAVDLATQTVLWKLKVGDSPAGVWLTPHDKYLLVGMTGADYAAVVDWRNRKVIKTIPTGKGAHNFRSLADGKHVLISNRVSNTISIIDQDALTKVGDISGLLAGPDDMELSSDRKTLWVTFRWARKVGIIDLPSRKLINTIPVGRSPHGIYFFDRAPVL